MDTTSEPTDNTATPDVCPPQTGTQDVVGDQDSATLEFVKQDVLAAIATFSARADFYENLVRQLQQRIEVLQAEQIQELLSPVLQRLAILLTQATDSAARARNHDGDYQADIEFEHFSDLIVEALGLVSVNSVEAATGAPFDRAMHAARKAIPTPDPSLDGTIAKVLRQGLIRDTAERAFLPAQVTVFRHTPGETVEPNPQPENEGEQP